jgi:N utilization substance protein A
MVVVPDDQLSLAIGREGQNARLAAKLTGWRIDIKSLTEAATDAHRKLLEVPAFAETAASNPDLVASAGNVLAKKAEGKPITPEEYQQLAKLVDLVEKRVAKGRQEERAAKVEKVAAIKATIPAAAYKVPLSTVNLSDRAQRVLAEADFQTVGQVMEQLALDEDRILGLEGYGPKMLDDLKTALAAVVLPEEVVEAPPAEAPAAELAPEAAPEAVAEPGVVEAVSEPAAPESEAVAAAPAEAVEAETVPAEAQETLAIGEPAAVEEEAEEEGEDKDAEDGGDGRKKGKKKGKKKGAVEITYDEDLGMFITRKKRKPGRAKDEMFGGLSDE